MAADENDTARERRKRYLAQAINAQDHAASIADEELRSLWERLAAEWRKLAIAIDPRD